MSEQPKKMEVSRAGVGGRASNPEALEASPRPGNPGREAAALALLARELSESRLHEELSRGLVQPPPATGIALRERMVEVGARLLGLSLGELPDRLVDLRERNPAPLLTTTVPAVVLNRPAVAVVGTRRATAGGLELAYNLGAYLAGAGIVVVSGLARGIDAAAHRGVVDQGGVGIAVLGSGIDVVYPHRHAGLAAGLARAGGGLVSQYSPGALPLGWRFPRRNRLLAAMVDAVVVVEAHVTGGALITAGEALELGREVLAVPGSPLVPAAAGCNRLLRDGAGVVAEFADVVDALGGEGPQVAPPWSEPGVSDPLCRRLLDLMTAEPLPIETLVRLARHEATEVSRALARLELAGVVARERGGVRRRARGVP